MPSTNRTVAIATIACMAMWDNVQSLSIPLIAHDSDVAVTKCAGSRGEADGFPAGAGTAVGILKDRWMEATRK